MKRNRRLSIEALDDRILLTSFLDGGVGIDTSVQDGTSNTIMVGEMSLTGGIREPV